MLSRRGHHKSLLGNTGKVLLGLGMKAYESRKEISEALRLAKKVKEKLKHRK